MLPVFGNAIEDRFEGFILNEHQDFRPAPTTNYNFPGPTYSAIIGGPSFYLEKDSVQTSPVLLQPIVVSSNVPPGTISQIAKETGRIVVQHEEDKDKQTGRGEETVVEENKVGPASK